MSQFELYQSILLKLGQLPSANLADVDAFLSEITKKKKRRPKVKYHKTNLSEIAGAWRDWDETEFNSFLDSILQIRSEMFLDRDFSI